MIITFKQILSNYFGKNNKAFKYPLIINSYGRSGSTVLTNSVIKSAIKYNNKKIRDIVFRSMSQFAWDLENGVLKDGIVYKTHDYPPVNKFKGNIRMLYTFANPIDVILSLLRLYDERGEEWIKEHYKHLRAPYTCFENIIEEDQLRLEDHLDSWLNEERFPIAFIKYETMWDHQDEISNFLNFKITLPPFKKRTAKQHKDEELKEKIKQNYSSLIKKFHHLENYFEINL